MESTPPTIMVLRELTTKFDEIKRQGRLSLRSSPEFYRTDWIADSSVSPAASSSSATFVTFSRNPDTNAELYIVRQTSSTSSLFNHQLQTQRYESKVILTNYAFGSSRLVHSTAQVFFAGTIDRRDILFLYGNASQEHTVALTLTGTPNRLQQSSLINVTHPRGTRSPWYGHSQFPFWR
ncbi:hypothetical protein H0H93_015597 [Arthromyces matolae]|nr:hypothetical protein H0H93_015597 [Arthromyces matolae]